MTIEDTLAMVRFAACDSDAAQAFNHASGLGVLGASRAEIVDAFNVWQQACAAREEARREAAAAGAMAPVMRRHAGALVIIRDVARAFEQEGFDSVAESLTERDAFDELVEYARLFVEAVDAARNGEG